MVAIVWQPTGCVNLPAGLRDAEIVEQYRPRPHLAEGSEAWRPYCLLRLLAVDTAVAAELSLVIDELSRIRPSGRARGDVRQSALASGQSTVIQIGGDGTVGNLGLIRSFYTASASWAQFDSLNHDHSLEGRHVKGLGHRTGVVVGQEGRPLAEVGALRRTLLDGVHGPGEHRNLGDSAAEQAEGPMLTIAKEVTALELDHLHKRWRNPHKEPSPAAPATSCTAVWNCPILLRFGFGDRTIHA